LLRATPSNPDRRQVDDFLEANRRALAQQKLVVVKFYSTSCRACLRIAAQYRRLALEDQDSIACYECEVSDPARPLYERLEVKQVPSVQIIDPLRVTLLASYSCKPKDFKRVVAKVRVATASMKKRRGLHRLFGESLLDRWVLNTDDPGFFATG